MAENLRLVEVPKHLAGSLTVFLQRKPAGINDISMGQNNIESSCPFDEIRHARLVWRNPKV